jgi:glutamyl-tRNA synthetase
VDGIRSALLWAGLDYDFGADLPFVYTSFKMIKVLTDPGKGRPQGPYFQSQRLDLYHSYATKTQLTCPMYAVLTSELYVFQLGHTYRCFCTPDHLALKREKLARSGSNSTYNNTCLHLTEEEVTRKVHLGEKSVVRLNVRYILYTAHC